jgi:hypothetical protein
MCQIIERTALPFQPPRDLQGIGRFAPNDDAPFFKCFYGVPICALRSHQFAVLQPAQYGIAAQRISLKLVAVLQVRNDILFSVGEFRQLVNTARFLIS